MTSIEDYYNGLYQYYAKKRNDRRSILFVSSQGYCETQILLQNISIH